MMIENELYSQGTKQQRQCEKSIGRIARVDGLKWAVSVCLEGQPQAGQPAIHKFEEISRHTLVSLINQRVAVNIHIFQALVAGRAFPLFRTDDGHSETMPAQAGGLLPDAPVKWHRQVLDDNQDVALASHLDHQLAFHCAGLRVRPVPVEIDYERAGALQQFVDSLEVVSNDQQLHVRQLIR